MIISYNKLLLHQNICIIIVWLGNLENFCTLKRLWLHISNGKRVIKETTSLHFQQSYWIELHWMFLIDNAN